VHPAPKPIRARDPIWDALVTLMGYEPQTKNERSNWGACVKQLKEADATPGEVARRGANYRAHYSDEIDLTPNALVKHWGELASVRARAAPHRGGNSPPEPPPVRDYRNHGAWKSST
jgi:hypothetical protein